MRFFHTFRGRLVLILAVLLLATISVQYYLNLRTQRENNDRLDAQTRALVAGITLGSNGITSTEYMQDLLKRSDQTYFDETATERIKDVIIINSSWQVIDSLNPDYLPTRDENGETVLKPFIDLTDLPPLMEATRLGSDLRYFPNAGGSFNNDADDESWAVPVETSSGRYYVIVLLKNDRREAAKRAAMPLIVTLAVLFTSTLITFFLVWRFTRPIANLSHAAREVADGNLKVRVPDAHRSDEMGRLAENFNEMAAELEKSRDLEAQLQQAEKSAVVGRLGSAIAHEIRNPLNYINLTLDHLRSKFAPDDKEKRLIFEKLTSQLKAEVARINQQISDFLNYSRPANPDLKPIDARKVIEDSLRLVEPEAEEKNIKIGIVEHENVPKILGDPEYLRSVFNNLLINATHSMETSGGHLNIKIFPDGDGQLVNFEISDTGNGISEENLSNIFEPYFSTKETGTGLGLAIVQKIVEIHNGRIDVESKEGVGTKFTVRLPRSVEGQGAETRVN